MDLEERDWSADEFKLVLTRFTEEMDYIREMNTQARVGMILTLSHDLKDSSLPYPDKVRER